MIAAAAVIRRKTLAAYQTEKEKKPACLDRFSILLRCGEGTMIDIPPRGRRRVTKPTCTHSELDSDFTDEDWLESRAAAILVGGRVAEPF